MSKPISLLGATGMITAAIWWHTFYSSATWFIFANENLPFDCLLHLSSKCQSYSDLAGLLGINSYNPLLFWVGFILFCFGLFPAAKHRNVEEMQNT